ncbi:MAG: SBBP repeat-containing protein, partial [Syntrophales bacterium]
MYGTISGTAVDDVATSVAVDSRGYIFITGWTTGDLDGAGPGPFGQEDIFLAMYYDTGNRSWLIQRGTTESDIATGIAVDNSGSTYWVYLTGATKGNLDGIRTTSTGNDDIFLVQYDISTASTPTWTWTAMLGTASDDAALAINARNANVHIAGVTGGSLDGHTSAGGNDIFVAAYDHSGTKLWTTQQGTSANDIAYGITVDNIGNSYVSGFSTGGQTNAGSADIFIVMFYLPGGNPAWGTLIGNSGDNEGRGIVLNAAEDTLYMTGFTQGDLDGQPSAGGYDTFLMKFAAATGSLQ